MSKDIQIFNNDKFGQLRTVIIDNEPWFVGKDLPTRSVIPTQTKP